jgi:hypothetical protein
MFPLTRPPYHSFIKNDEQYVFSEKRGCFEHTTAKVSSPPRSYRFPESYYKYVEKKGNGGLLTEDEEKFLYSPQFFDAIGLLENVKKTEVVDAIDTAHDINVTNEMLFFFCATVENKKKYPKEDYNNLRLWNYYHALRQYYNEHTEDNVKKVNLYKKQFEALKATSYILENKNVIKEMKPPTFLYMDHTPVLPNIKLGNHALFFIGTLYKFWEYQLRKIKKIHTRELTQASAPNDALVKVDVEIKKIETAFVEYKNSHTVSNKLLIKKQSYRMLKKIWDHFYNKNFEKRLKKLYLFAAKAQNVRNIATYLKSKKEFLMKASAEPLDLKRNDKEDPDLNTLKSNILKALQAEYNSVLLGMARSDRQTEKVKHRLEELEALAPQILLDVSDRKEQLIKFAANQVALHQKINEVHDMHTSISAALIFQATEVNKTKKFLLDERFNLDKYEREKKKITNKYKRNRRRIKNLIKELSDTVITFNTETRNNSKFLQDYTFNLRNSLNERVKKLQGEITSYQDSTKDFFNDYTRRIIEKSNSVFGDTIGKLETACHTLFAEKSTLFDNVIDNKVADFTNLKIQQLLKNERTGLDEIRALKEEMYQEIHQMRGEKNKLISEIAKYKKEHRQPIELEVIGKKNQTEVKGKRTDKPPIATGISLAAWSRELENSIYLPDLLDWAVKPYLSPIKKMPYDERMSYDEWNFQKSRNRCLITKETTRAYLKMMEVQ